LSSEEVDERILKLLGLDEVFDIDYATYMTLLRGKMAEARMVDKKLSTDETYAYYLMSLKELKER
jgi:hypothetical protein